MEPSLSFYVATKISPVEPKRKTQGLVFTEISTFSRWWRFQFFSFTDQSSVDSYMR